MHQSSAGGTVKRDEINDWLQVLGLLAVAVSLGFVAYELKQSREIAMADIYQQRTAMGFELVTEPTNNQAYVNGWEKLKRGEKPTAYELSLIDADFFRWLTHWENLHFQYQIGLLTQEQWDASLSGLRHLIKEQQFLELWNDHNQSGWRASYKDLINQLIREEKTNESSRG